MAAIWDGDYTPSHRSSRGSDREEMYNEAVDLLSELNEDELVSIGPLSCNDARVCNF